MSSYIQEPQLAIKCIHITGKQSKCRSHSLKNPQKEDFVDTFLKKEVEEFLGNWYPFKEINDDKSGCNARKSGFQA